MNRVHDRLLDPKLTFLTAEANFNLSEYVNYIHTLYYMDPKSVKKTVGCKISHTISGTRTQHN
jgi:hypothetical protein